MLLNPSSIPPLFLTLPLLLALSVTALTKSPPVQNHSVKFGFATWFTPGKNNCNARFSPKDLVISIPGRYFQGLDKDSPWCGAKVCVRNLDAPSKFVTTQVLDSTDDLRDNLDMTKAVFRVLGGERSIRDGSIPHISWSLGPCSSPSSPSSSSSSSSHRLVSSSSSSKSSIPLDRASIQPMKKIVKVKVIRKLKLSDKSLLQSSFPTPLPSPPVATPRASPPAQASISPSAPRITPSVKSNSNTRVPRPPQSPPRVKTTMRSKSPDARVKVTIKPRHRSKDRSRRHRRDGKDHSTHRGHHHHHHARTD